MSDGGVVLKEAAEKELLPQASSSSSQQQQHYTRNPSGNEDFIRSIAKISVAQICENEGFQGFHQSALDAFSDVAVRYLKEVGKSSNLYATLAGRSDCNVYDIIQGLEDLGFVQGFPAASDVHRSISRSGVVREIEQYVNFVEDVPFVFDVPRFPVSVEVGLPRSFEQLGEEPPGEHIPGWLPAFPRKEGLDDGNVGSAGVEQRVEVAKVEVREREGEGEREQHLVGNDRVEGNVNPFLAPPLRFGERDVAVVEPPSRFFMGNHHGDMMEMCGGMVESEGLRKDLCEVEERRRTPKSDERPKVRLKFSNVKKTLPVFDSVFDLKKRDEKLAGFDGIEEDSKKSLAEEISKGSMEIPQMDSTEDVN